MRHLLLFLLMMLTPIVQAQSEDEGWEIIEDCVSEPTAPPDDWTYDGTIIMWGDFGLHGMQAAWDTPRVLAFLPSSAEDDGNLSPNGEYFGFVNRELLPYENSQTGFGGIVEIDNITIYDTTDNTEFIFEIDIENTYSVWNRDWSVRQLRWLDNTHIVYEVGNEGEQIFNLDFVKIIDITTSEQSDWEYPVNPLDNHSFYPSPDLNFAIQGDSFLSLFSITDNEIIFQGSDLNLRDFILGEVAWSPNSEFVTIAVRDRSASSFKIFALYTNEETLFIQDIPITENPYFPIISVSADGQYVAYFYETLHIVDIEAQHIINTCISDEVNSLIWSPDENQLAYYLRGSGQQAMNIYDLNLNQVFTVGYHRSSYFNAIEGWRAD